MIKPIVTTPEEIAVLRATFPPHMQPVLAAVETCRIACLLLAPNLEPFDAVLADVTPWLAIIGDDQPGDGGSAGPAAFHAASISALFKSASAAVVLSATAEERHYTAACAIPVVERRNCVLVETREEHEIEWQQIALDNGIRRILVITPRALPNRIEPISAPPGTLLN